MKKLTNKMKNKEYRTKPVDATRTDKSHGTPVNLNRKARKLINKPKIICVIWDIVMNIAIFCEIENLRALRA